MSFLLTAALLVGMVVSVPVAGAALCRHAVRRRQETQRQLADRHSHLAPVASWPVAFASQAHMEALFKIWSWEDVGVLHLYEDAVAFYGNGNDFEVAREALERVAISVWARTNPLVPWIEVVTTSGVRYFFCVPEGVHVFGMRARAEEVFRALERWSRGSAARPLRIE